MASNGADGRSFAPPTLELKLVGIPALGPADHAFNGELLKDGVDLLLNATALGLNGDDASPLDGKEFSLREACAVYDMIYRPAETPLLKAAKAAGCRTANGLGMLLYQGAKALELWSGKPAPIEVMRRALARNIYGH